MHRKKKMFNSNDYPFYAVKLLTIHLQPPFFKTITKYNLRMTQSNLHNIYFLKHTGVRCIICRGTATLLKLFFLHIILSTLSEIYPARFSFTKNALKNGLSTLLNPGPLSSQSSTTFISSSFSS